MSQRYSSVDSILAMLDGNFTEADIITALADLEAMKKSITKNKYESVKKLLEDKLKRF